VFLEYGEPIPLNPDGPLVEDRNLWTRTVRLFGAASSLGHFRVLAELHDGSLVASPVAEAGPDCFGG
jgi:hypothetical protein